MNEQAIRILSNLSSDTLTLLYAELIDKSNLYDYEHGGKDDINGNIRDTLNKFNSDIGLVEHVMNDRHVQDVMDNEEIDLPF
tara:strand:- start:32 stop:277 length:246 start_codon:yes stop_codon:yes gene_type:complete